MVRTLSSHMGTYSTLTLSYFFNLNYYNMSIERKCKLCGAEEGVRFNFIDQSEEIRFHIENDGKCMNFKSCEIEQINKLK